MQGLPGIPGRDGERGPPGPILSSDNGLNEEEIRNICAAVVEGISEKRNPEMEIVNEISFQNN